MAAKTPSTIKEENAGSLKMIIATFADVDDGDTWASGLGTTPVTHVFSRTDNPTTQASAGVAVSHSAGTFTFYPAEDDTAGDLIVYVRQ